VPTTEQLTCPKCQGELAKIFTGQRPRRRAFACPKCDLPPDPIATPEALGWVKSSHRPPEYPITGTSLPRRHCFTGRGSRAHARSCTTTSKGRGAAHLRSLDGKDHQRRYSGAS
jgi:hypothetical protein